MLNMINFSLNRRTEILIGLPGMSGGFSISRLLKGDRGWVSKEDFTSHPKAVLQIILKLVFLFFFVTHIVFCRPTFIRHQRRLLRHCSAQRKMVLRAHHTRLYTYLSIQIYIHYITVKGGYIFINKHLHACTHTRKLSNAAVL